MNSNIFAAVILLVIIAFDFKCNGKYVTINAPDIFPIQKLSRISATCKSNQVDSECNDNLEYAIDGDSNTFWRVPSFVNGESLLTFHFEQAIHIVEISIEFDGSKRTPAIWSLEKSIDHGKTWSVWQYFVKDPDNCDLFAADAVICSSQSCNKNRAIIIDLKTMHQQMDTKSGTSETFYELTRATSIRFHSYEWKVNFNNQNISEYRHFYAVKDIEIMGYCEQNGHFDGERTELGYQCKHNTDGICCSQCKAGFEKKQWKPNTNEQPFECESCKCYGHSDHCTYNETERSDVCHDCQHNTTGNNCNQCKSGFYRPHGKQWNDADVCKPCNCNMVPSSTGNCEEETGNCECQPEFQGIKCESCSLGYSGYPDCKPCSSEGTNITESSPNKCSCKLSFVGELCDRCICSYIKYPHCGEIDRIRKSVEADTWFINNSSCTDVITLNFLHLAVVSGQTDLVTELTQFGVPIDVPTMGAHTALHLSAAEGLKDMVFQLIMHGANANHRDYYGKTPLDYVSDKNSEIARLLQVAMFRDSNEVKHHDEINAI